MEAELSGLHGHLLDVSFKFYHVQLVMWRTTTDHTVVIHEPTGTTQQLTLVKLSLITFCHVQSTFLYLKHVVNMTKQSKKDWQQRAHCQTHGELGHGFYGSETISISIFRAVTAPRHPAFSKIVIFQSNVQKSKEGPDYSAFRSVHAIKSTCCHTEFL